ncbi:potassium transporter Kup [Limnobacter litoralis]|uniref:Probable potassium transport system protein Kup n=1 Tax=Limnobacter litoralis TaxID=481366 RepID=A0ABQ5YP94_9BURK|nr:potassium transporter Kup [Limnobacter litoralis]GLR25932.1 putative potassium transport system protein kup [Limnobacter litoralis]
MTDKAQSSSVAALTLGAIGVVYGDIGTSPLYTMKEVFSPEYGVALVQANVLGVVSMIVWGLTFFVSLKYVTLILRADNRGEGGIMALVALTLSAVGRNSRFYSMLCLIGLIGAALFFGDGVITPAISVLSAVEGLQVAAPHFKPFIIPTTVMILTCLYWIQHRGTGGISRLVGPIMLVWFVLLAGLGIVNIIQNPVVLKALNPYYAFLFVIENRGIAFVALGAIVLAFTGAEALYADMGHFGKSPIRRAWFCVVFPSLSLNYLGQGGLLLAHPEFVTNPFYQQLGPWSVFPLLVMATIATIIASQATISGTYSIVQQAISLGFLPRMKIVYTSAVEKGQIFIPLINWLQYAAVVGAVVLFGESSNLATAYGIAVTLTMLMTTILTFFVIRYKWKMNLALCLAVTGLFTVFDSVLFAANTLKLEEGGWFPVLLGVIMFVIMLTWRDGRELVKERLNRDFMPLKDFLGSLFIQPPTRVPGTAVFFRPIGEGVPHAMLQNMIHNKVIHERIIFLTLYILDEPAVDDADRIRIESLGENCFILNVYYGFKENADIPAALDECERFGMEISPMETSYFISRQNIIPKFDSEMAPWREVLYSVMARNARDAADYYQVPSNRVIELGSQVEI